jgi:hypothetical protein
VYAKQFPCLWYIRRKLCPFLRRNYNYLQIDQNELPLDPCHLGVQSGTSKMIYEPMLRLAQTIHLPCVEINTILKWIERSFQLTHITKEYHQLRPKWFSNLWYVLRKSCTYLASRLTLSPNRLKWSSTWNELPLDQGHLEVPSGVPKHFPCPR